MSQRYPVPPPAGSYTPAYVPVISYFGGVVSDVQKFSQANVTNDFTPKTQPDKAAVLGVSPAVDVGQPVGPVAPGQRYPVAADTPPVAPVVSSIAPNTAVAGSDAPVVVTITGTGFTEWSRVYTGNYGVAAPTAKYVSPTKMTVVMYPKNAAVGPTAIVVEDHGTLSNNDKVFNFT